MAKIEEKIVLPMTIIPKVVNWLAKSTGQVVWFTSFLFGTRTCETCTKSGKGFWEHVFT